MYGARTAWRTFAITMAIIASAYLLLLNPYWVPGGDSELYLAAGRSLAQGHGYRFNGQRINISPPGWPLVLAGAMKVMPTFAFIKLITIACMTGTLALWYWLLLRFTSPVMSAIVTLVTAVSSHVYSLSFWAHSDALFCLIALAAMIVACQINESRRGIVWRIILLLILCAAATFVRWAALAQWVIICGLLLRGHDLPFTWSKLKRAKPWQINAAWVAVILSGVVTFGTYKTINYFLRLTTEQELAAREAGVTFEDTQSPITQPAPENKAPELINARPLGKRNHLEEFAERLIRAGRWIAWLLWPEMRFIGAAKLKALNSLDTVFGWFAVVFIAAAAIKGVQHRQWVWLALAAYCFAMFINWPNPNARYLVPVAPLIVWGVIRGIYSIGKGRTWTTIHQATFVAFVASVFVANAALYGVDVWVARSGEKFYQRYEGGMDQSLIAAANYLRTQNVRDKSIAVSEEYINLGHRRFSKFGLRALVMLTELRVRTVPPKASDEPATSPKFLRWARNNKVHWYAFQDEVSPWRVWHFRIPAWLQAKLSDEPVKPPTAGWTLYHRLEGDWSPVEISPQIANQWPTRVPGM
jgi:hypothetical protein